MAYGAICYIIFLIKYGFGATDCIICRVYNSGVSFLMCWVSAVAAVNFICVGNLKHQYKSANI